METAIWVIGIVAAVLIIVIYIITSVNKYSNSFVEKYFDGDDKGKASGSDLTKAQEKIITDEKVDFKNPDQKSDQN
ncbi:MAG: hypothetical protein WAT71_08065 [Ignavibacteria bacterium]